MSSRLCLLQRFLLGSSKLCFTLKPCFSLSVRRRRSWRRENAGIGTFSNQLPLAQTLESPWDIKEEGKTLLQNNEERGRLLMNQFLVYHSLSAALGDIASRNLSLHTHCVLHWSDTNPQAGSRTFALSGHQHSNGCSQGTHSPCCNSEEAASPEVRVFPPGQD